LNPTEIDLNVRQIVTVTSFRKTGYILTFKKIARCEKEVGGNTSADYLKRKDRIAAYRKEIVFSPDYIEFEHLAPDVMQ
jgi:hypothetical protein